MKTESIERQSMTFINALAPVFHHIILLTDLKCFVIV